MVATGGSTEVTAELNSAVSKRIKETKKTARKGTNIFITAFYGGGHAPFTRVFMIRQTKQ